MKNLSLKLALMEKIVNAKLTNEEIRAVLGKVEEILQKRKNPPN
jgi:hypothetical protein